jgi:D-alanyl-lipoteichoic acid acyltransferase DltB (MBOAT superfamily)
LIISGLFKKLIISDYITLNFVDYVFDDPARYTGLENLFAVYGYAAVIYCDFSGYSDVAIGIAKWLGFSIPTNFLSPYQSKNITEFWRRWHISLSSWLKDYLYIPLGGNKKAGFGTFLFAGLFLFGVAAGCKNLLHLSWLLSIIISFGTLLLFLIPALVYRENKSIFTGFNLLTTMLLGGFWHGASWNFIIWGALHGVALAIHKIWLLLTKKLPDSIQQAGWMKAIAIFITFHFVCFCWIFFKAANFTAATAMIQQIVGDFDWSVWGAFAKNYKSVLWMIAIAAVIHALPDNLADKLLQRFHKIPLLAYLGAFFVFLLVYGVFKSSEQVLPIYLKF